MSSVLSRSGFVRPRIVFSEEAHIPIAGNMAAPYIDEISANAVASVLNSNNKCNRYVTFQFMRAMGVDFQNHLFTDDTIHFSHFNRTFTLIFDDDVGIISLRLDDRLWCECVKYRNLHMDFQFDNAVPPQLIGAYSTNQTLTQANILLSFVQLQFYFVLLRAAELNIEPSSYEK